MPSRTRTHQSQIPEGYWVADFGTSGTENSWLTNDISTCVDDTSPGDCWPLAITRVNFDGARFTTKPAHWHGTQFFDYVVDYMKFEGNFPADVTPSDFPPLAALAAKAVARTNPSRPYVDIPVALAELGDVATLIRDTGRHIYGSIGDWNLRYQYGIKPLVGDLVNLFNLREAVKHRIKEIQRLNSPKGLRRTVKLGEWVDESGKYYTTVQSNQAFVSTWIERKTTLTASAHVRWKPQFTPDISLGRDELDAMARKALLGLTIDKSTLWEALPWSWLIDWCSNIGDYFQANRNIIPAVLEGCWLSWKHDHKWIITGGELDAFKLTDGYYNKYSIVRNKVNVFPTAHFPFLNGTQAGIAASLAVMRMK